MGDVDNLFLGSSTVAHVACRRVSSGRRGLSPALTLPRLMLLRVDSNYDGPRVSWVKWDCDYVPDTVAKPEGGKSFSAQCGRG